jgi:hypothetical protein
MVKHRVRRLGMATSRETREPERVTIAATTEQTLTMNLSTI